MDKTFLKRGMASALSLVMAFSTAVPSSLVYAEETTGIESEIEQDLTATLGQTENGKVSFVSDGNETQDPTTYGPGDKVKVAANPEEGFNTTKIEVKNSDGTVVASIEDGKVTEADGAYNFEMPETDVTVDATFEAAPATTEEATEAPAETAEAETETAAEPEAEKAEEAKKQIFEEFVG